MGSRMGPAQGDSMRVDVWDPRKDGAFSESALRRKLEERGYRVSRYVYPAGTVFDTHVHDDDKIDAVVSGRFAVSMQGETVELGPGDAVHVPRGMAHSAEVLGEDSVVSFDAIKVSVRGM